MNNCISYQMRVMLSFCCVLLATASIPSAIAQNLSIETIVSPPKRADGWAVGDATSAGFDTNAITALAKDLHNNKYSNLHSVLIEHDGKLVYEQYLSGTDQRWGRPLGHVEFNRSTQHDLRSVTKSVTSLLLGIAIGSNYETALQRSIIDVLPKHQDKADPAAAQITLHHVLTMTSGLEWNEMEVPYSNPENDERRLSNTDDPVGFVLKRPLREAPGTRWYYNGGLTMVLAGAVVELSGQPLVDYAKKVLFGPLQIKEFEWIGGNFWPGTGLPSAASGLRMTPRDTAKIGSLMLNGGRWNGKQVVPEAWIKHSGKRHRDDLGPWGADGVYGYGFQWWHGEFPTETGTLTAIAAVGYGGQRVFILPEHKLVVTIFSGNYATTDWWKSERVMKRIAAALR